jgi:hypothetical protein
MTPLPGCILEVTVPSLIFPEEIKATMPMTEVAVSSVPAVAVLEPAVLLVLLSIKAAKKYGGPGGTMPHSDKLEYPLPALTP